MKVPVIVQMHSGENGATALSMILSYYKKYLPMETIRSKCLFTRNGSTPGQLLEAAQFFGMDGEVRKLEQDAWKKMTFPCSCDCCGPCGQHTFENDYAGAGSGNAGPWG